MEEQNGKEKNRIRIEPSPKAADPDEEFYEEIKYEQHHENAWLFYDVLAIIFRYLNYKDLSNTMMVCRKWLEVASREKCLRGPQCFMKYIDPYVCSIESEKYDFTCIGQSTIKPFIALFFLPSVASYDYIIDSIFELLPTNCKIIMLFTPTVILNERIHISDLYCDESSLSGFHTVYALFPQMSNVELNMVIVTNTINTSKDTMYTEYTQMIEKASRQNHEISACLMLFCYKNSESIGKRMVQIACSRLGNSERMVSMYGGVVNSQYNSLAKKSQSWGVEHCVALLITGSIRTWSIVLEDCLTIELVKEKLKLFQEQVKLQKHSVGFVLSSHVRHKLDNMMRLYDDDLTIFKELFPKVPLVGYGIKQPDWETPDVLIMPPQIGPQWSSFATFVILTYD